MPAAAVTDPGPTGRHRSAGGTPCRPRLPRHHGRPLGRSRRRGRRRSRHKFMWCRGCRPGPRIRTTPPYPPYRHHVPPIARAAGPRMPRGCPVASGRPPGAHLRLPVMIGRWCLPCSLPGSSPAYPYNPLVDVRSESVPTSLVRVSVRKLARPPSDAKTCPPSPIQQILSVYGLRYILLHFPEQNNLDTNV